MQNLGALAHGMATDEFEGASNSDLTCATHSAAPHLAEVGMPTARRHIFKRRGQLRPSSDVAFLPVDVVAQWPQEAPALGDSIVPSIVELCLMQGRRLRFDSGIDGAILMRLIRNRCERPT